MKGFASSVLVGAILLCGAGVRSDARGGPEGGGTEGEGPEEYLGNPDPGLPCQVAQKMTFGEIRQAIYEGPRSLQLLALDGAGCMDSFDILPYLAALMGARDRQIALRSASSFAAQVGRAASNPARFVEVVAKQAGSLVGQLMEVARNPRVDLDIRISALTSAGIIEEGAHISPADTTWGLSDEEGIIKEVALHRFALPLTPDQLTLLATIAREDEDPRFRGMATAVVCENALVHGVQEPSADLGEMLKAALADGKIPSEGVASILACVKRFSAAGRADFVSGAMANPDPAVSEYWNSLD